MKLPLVMVMILAAAPAAAQDMEPKAYSASPVGPSSRPLPDLPKPPHSAAAV